MMCKSAAVFGLTLGLLASDLTAEVLSEPLPFLEDVRWGSAPLCGPEAVLTDQAAIDAFALENPNKPPIYLDEYGIAFAAEPVFCSFHSVLAGPLADEGVFITHLICSIDDRFSELMTLALIYQGQTVGDSTPTISLLSEARPEMEQPLYLCATN